MKRLALAAIAAVCVSASAWAAPLGVPATTTVDHGALLLIKDKHDGSHDHGPSKGKHYGKPGHHYTPGHKYNKAPKGWKKHGKRPGDWKKRGCIVVGPLWFCP